MGDVPVPQDEEQIDERARLKSAILSHTIRHLEPATPVWVKTESTVAEAVTAMVEGGMGSVLVGDPTALEGIFTERDVMKRVVHAGLDAKTTRVGDVMTADPDVLTADDRVGYTLKKMVLRKYRHIPVVDKQGRVVGVISARSVAKFIVSIFPEATLNLPPGDELKNPNQMDSG